jgi:hypothetical protein
VVGGAGIYDLVGDRGRHHRHGVEGVGQRLLVPRAHPRCPRRWRRRHHGQRKGWADLLRRKVIGESAGQHGRRGRLLDVDPPPPETRSHLDGAGPGVEVGRPRGVAALALRGGGGGVAAEGTTAAMAAAATGATVVMPPSLRLARLVVVVGHRRWWRSTPSGGTAHRRGGTAHQRGDAAEEGWVGGCRLLGFGSSRSKKKNLSSEYHVGERCATEY